MNYAALASVRFGIDVMGQFLLPYSFIPVSRTDQTAVNLGPSLTPCLSIPDWLGNLSRHDDEFARLDTASKQTHQRKNKRIRQVGIEHYYFYFLSFFPESARGTRATTFPDGLLEQHPSMGNNTQQDMAGRTRRWWQTRQRSLKKKSWQWQEQPRRIGPSFWFERK